MIQAILVQPNSTHWPLYLQLCYTYLEENWPKVDLSRYEEQLIQRYTQGNRAFFLYFQQDEPVGISNAYIEKNALYIAELYVLPQLRRMRYATHIQQHLLHWGKEQKATRLQVEVDKDQPQANAFWSSCNLQLDTKGFRNLYFTKIE